MPSLVWFGFLVSRGSGIFQDSLFLVKQTPSEKPDVSENTNSSVLYFILGLHCEEDKKALEGVIPAAPSGTLKRQLPSDAEDKELDVNTPEKIPKKGQQAASCHCVLKSKGESISTPLT